MDIKTIRYVAGDTVNAQLIGKKIQKKYNIQEAIISPDIKLGTDINIIIVIGGDGELLQALNQFLHLNVSFYGINSGNLGFLMNSYNDSSDLMELIYSSEIIFINPLQAQVNRSDGSSKCYLAFNECTILRKTSQVTKLEIRVDNITQLPSLLGDGILVSTIVGSTAYNYAVGGLVLPLSANLLPITAISPFRPRRWRGALISKTSVIDIIVHDYVSRPAYFTADLQEIDNVISAKITEAQNKQAKLLFCKNNSLELKLIKEQFK